MRMLLKWELGLAAANDAIRSGEDGRAEPVTHGADPTSGCLFRHRGWHTHRLIFFNLDDPALIPVIAEPLFQELQSKVEFIPVMNADDLQRGLANMAKEG